jgi:hypothetical protein
VPHSIRQTVAIPARRLATTVDWSALRYATTRWSSATRVVSDAQALLTLTQRHHRARSATIARSW